MTSLDVFQIILIEAGTAFGSAIGAETAKFLLEGMREKRKRAKENENEQK